MADGNDYHLLPSAIDDISRTSTREPTGNRMRGDQLTRQWRVLRRIEASRRDLTAGKIANDTGKHWRFVEGWRPTN